MGTFGYAETSHLIAHTFNIFVMDQDWFTQCVNSEWVIVGLISYDTAHWYIYCKTYNINHTLLGNIIVDHSDLVGALPVGADPTTSSFST